MIKDFDSADKLVSLIRSARAEQKVKPRQTIDLYAPSHVLDLLERVNGFVQILAGIGEIYPLSEAKTENSSVLTFEGAEIRISGLDNDVDLAAQESSP